ncbi:hypothetical protein K432DRAFT_351507 [Lepidopterella palustris CBS 459.81]|uniref:Uncharacterized protein n=1 Tax=Lepidopterella palustris CBS 459.81 TaxID=1314670 RepID=A0A8E2ECB3_9PEZI|nr:hypothetical protein K432DRAFT_351507 [Lepidopterella palustris CBS 459.81]
MPVANGAKVHTKPPAARPKKPAANGMANGAMNGHIPSPYEIMASRIMNRVGEMAENISLVEREKPSPTPKESQQKTKKPPRKLEMRLGQSGTSPTNISFSAPFLDNTLSKMLALQGRMLKVGQELAASEDVEEEVKHEQFAQSAELSRIIALICAEKARQGA